MGKLSEWLKAQRAGAADNVRFFSEAGRPERERALVAEFLRCLGVSVTPDELRLPPQDDDVDVQVGEARFQNIELLDPARRRHDETRAFAEQVQRARRVAHLEMPRPPESVPMPLAELTAQVVAKLKQKKQARLPNRAHLDALVYVNLRNRHLYPVPTVLDDVAAVEGLGWRSVSALWPPLWNQGSCRRCTP